MKNYSDRKYTIEKYNSAWKSQFEKEADILRNIFGTSASSIEHVGSTAVPNLSGKPTIDVLVVVDNIEEIEKFIPSMIEDGYLDKGEYVTQNTRLLAREKDNERLVNVHIFPKGTTRIEQMLAVRDFLRTHPNKVEEYNQLKKELYATYSHDYGMYRKYKDEWMKKLIQSVCLPVNNIYITGVSGTGKSTVAQALKNRGYEVYSIDEIPGLCCWINKNNGKKVDYEAVLNKQFIDTHIWVCDIEKIKQILTDKKGVIVLGIAENQNEYVPLFDKVILLQCSPETFIKRIESRVDNDFGKDTGIQEHLLNTYQEFESNLLARGAIPINTERPIEEVANMIISEMS
jgi:GrpB-like predicted nucleotidyltransferase (UPF0157 family)/adenylate kinase family enzyme